MAVVALVLLLGTVSHAKQSLDQVLKQKGDTTTGLVVPASHSSKKTTSVPEPSIDVLLLIGIGVTGLVGYCVQRQKQPGI